MILVYDVALHPFGLPGLQPPGTHVREGYPSHRIWVGGSLCGFGLALRACTCCHIPPLGGLSIGGLLVVLKNTWYFGARLLRSSYTIHFAPILGGTHLFMRGVF